MKAGSRLTLLLAGLVVMSACSKSPLLGQGPGGTFTLSGVVTEDAPSGLAPVEGALVEVLNGRRTARTGTDGRYSFSGLGSGSVTIQVSKWQFEGVSQSMAVSGPSVADFRMARKPKFTLTGIVTEELNEGGRVPLEGVLVEVVLCPPQEGQDYTLVSTETDANGAYSVPDLCNGPTAVFPWREGYMLAPTSEPPCEGDAAECRWLTIDGDTRFDIRLVRR